VTGFGSLYYTDCLPGQGLQGGAGFQFQAASPGLATEAMPIVQRTLLYEAPSSWMRDRRAVRDYPLSLAHTADGAFATAAGRYLGQEANGTRQGNQFTHAAVTRDPADYGMVRPAQLWGAQWWATKPAAGTELDLLPAHPAPGPLDTETVRNRVRDAADGRERLIALLSAIHRLHDAEQRRTVVLVTEDPEQAACWIAAATLLLPRPQALQASFKIFVADAQYGQHDIIALHPEWAGRWADTGSGSGLAVFDLDRGRHSAVEPIPAALFWVPRFLTDDAYDVVDAVELAGQFAQARTGDPDPRSVGGVRIDTAPAEPTDADRLAAVVVATGERLSDPDRLEEVAHWLQTAPDEAIHIAGDPVLEAVLAASPPAPVLRRLAAAARSGRLPLAAARVQRGLLTAKIEEVQRTADGIVALSVLTALAPLQHLERSDEDREHGRAEIEAALRGARPDDVPALLTVAHRHDLRPATTNFGDAAYRFAAWWVERPEPGLEPSRWPAPPDALDWVRDTLRGWLAGEHRTRVEWAVRERWWRPLWEEASDPGDALDALLMGVAYEHVEGNKRIQLMRNVQEWTFARMPGGAHPSAVAWEILFGTRTPPLPEAAAFLAGLVERALPLSRDVWSRLCAVLERDASLSEDGLWMNDHLHRYGFPLPAVLAELRAREDAVLHIAAELAATAPTSTSDELARAMSDAAGPVLDFRAARVIDGLLTAPRDIALAVLLACSRAAAKPIYRELEARWPRQAGAPSEDQCRAVALTFVLAKSTPKRVEQRDDFRILLDRLGAVVAALPKDTRASIERSHGLGPRWRDWVSEIEPSLWKRPLGSLFGARSGKQSGKRGE